MKHILFTVDHSGGVVWAKRFLLVLAAMAAFVPIQALSQANSVNNKAGTTDEDAVRQTLDQIYAALGRNDAAALDRIYADDYTFINESGEFTTKGPRLAAIRSGELKYESLSFDNYSVRVHGDTAIATYKASVKARLKGREIGGRLRVTTTFVRMKGRWRLVAAQATSITEQ